MKLTETEKCEMLEDAQSAERRDDFRKMRDFSRFRDESFEEYALWLSQILSLAPLPKQKSDFVEYSNVKI